MVSRIRFSLQKKIPEFELHGLLLMIQYLVCQLDQIKKITFGVSTGISSRSSLLFLWYKTNIAVVKQPLNQVLHHQKSENYYVQHKTILTQFIHSKYKGKQRKTENTHVLFIIRELICGLICKYRHSALRKGTVYYIFDKQKF